MLPNQELNLVQMNEVYPQPSTLVSSIPLNPAAIS